MMLNGLLWTARHGAVLAGVLVMSSCALESAEDPAAGEDEITSNTEQAVDIALTAIGSILVSGDSKCLDVHSPDRVTNGGRVQIWECHGGINQQWRFAGNMLVSGNGMCLDVHYPDRVMFETRSTWSGRLLVVEAEERTEGAGADDRSRPAGDEFRPPAGGRSAVDAMPLLPMCDGWSRMRLRHAA
jgi:hypothetical protein